MAETGRQGYRTQRPRTNADRDAPRAEPYGARGPSRGDPVAGQDSPLGWANIARAARGLAPTTDTAATATDWALGRLLKEEAMLRHDMDQAAKRLAEIARQRAEFVAGEQGA